MFDKIQLTNLFKKYKLAEFNSDTQFHSIQCLNFAQNLFNLKSFEKNSVKQLLIYQFFEREKINSKMYKTSQELRMLSSVTINCQITKIVMNSGSQLSEL